MRRGAARYACLIASALCVGGAGSAARAEEKPRGGPAWVKEGNRLLAEGRYDEALSAYDAARGELPDSAEVAYNRGIALYRLGRYADAETAFQDALTPDRPDLEARAKYNLGRTAQAAAMAEDAELERAINDLTRAIGFYKDALQLRPDDADAKHNAALAERLRAYLTKKLEFQKQQERKQQEPSSQPGEKQEGDEGEEDEDRQQGDNRGGEDREGENQQRSEEGQPSEQDPTGQAGDEQTPDEQSPSTQPDREPQAASQPAQQQPTTQAAAQPKEESTTQPAIRPASRPSEAPEEDLKTAMIRLSKEQAMRMLQEARDAERKRREQRRLELMRRRGRIPVDKDW